MLDGWSLLEKLFKRRLVACGAASDCNLDAQLLFHFFRNDESLQSFFVRTQEFENEYKIMLRSRPQFVPKVKILMRFINLPLATQQAIYLACRSTLNLA